MARDIEEFLRRAAERRKQQQQKQRQPAAAAERVRKVVEDAEVEIVRKPAKPKPQPQKRPKSNLQKQRDLRNESVDEHVRQHINTSEISEHAKHLGDTIQHADERVSERLHQKFDHDFSHLDDLPTVQDDIVATVTQAESTAIARDLIKMLRSPQSVRQAILISEILQRPKFD